MKNKDEELPSVPHKDDHPRGPRDNRSGRDDRDIKPSRGGRDRSRDRGDRDRDRGAERPRESGEYIALLERHFALLGGTDVFNLRSHTSSRFYYCDTFNRSGRFSFSRSMYCHVRMSLVATPIITYH